MNRKGLFLKLFFGASILLIFWLKGTIFLDPDFGWRLQTGKLILSQGIPKTDPFTYTMPSFPWVDHAWITSLGIGWLYPFIGKLGLALVSSVLIFLSLVISASRIKTFDLSKKYSFINRPFKKDFWYFGSFVFLLALAVLLPFSGVRAQVITWLLLAILLRLVLDRKIWEKWRFGFPLFFVLWANLHGGFVAGISILFFLVISRAVREKKLKVVDVVVLSLTLLATFVNPYGAGSWKEVWSSVSDPYLRWQIIEWMPAVFMVDFSFAALVTLSALLVWRFRKKVHFEELGLYLVMLIQAILSRRHIPLWLIVSLPLTINLLVCFYQEVKNIPHAPARFKKSLKYAWIGSFIVLIFQIIFALRGAYLLSEDRFYPKEAISFIKQELPPGRIFSEYGWGGYLIWKLPEKKVFIDGRMPSWRWGGNSSQESGAAFDDYLSLLEGEISYQEIFEKYTIDTVLWPVSARPGFYDYLQDKLGNLLARFGRERKDFSFLEELEKQGWKEIYQDSVALIYQKQD